MNNLLAANVSGFVILRMGEEDREVDACTARLEQLKNQRADAKEGYRRAKLDAVIQNVRSQLEYVVERWRVKADIRRYEYDHKTRAP